jgi:hypothetical protein
MTGKNSNETWWWLLLGAHAVVDGGTGFGDCASCEVAAEEALRVWERPLRKSIP